MGRAGAGRSGGSSRPSSSHVSTRSTSSHRVSNPSRSSSIRAGTNHSNPRAGSSFSNTQHRSLPSSSPIKQEPRERRASNHNESQAVRSNTGHRVTQNHDMPPIQPDFWMPDGAVGKKPPRSFAQESIHSPAGPPPPAPKPQMRKIIHDPVAPPPPTHNPSKRIPARKEVPSTRTPAKLKGCKKNYWYGIIVGFGVVVAVLLLALAVVDVKNAESNTPASSYEREPLTGYAFNEACITDELGWFDDPQGTARELEKVFYKKTGVVPYIYLRTYDDSLTTDLQKEEWAQRWYSENVAHEGGALFVYFAEADADNDIGMMTMVRGFDAGSVMDSEAMDIFWTYIDKYWYSDLSTDEVFIHAFSDTADRIMQKTVTSTDVTMIFAKVLGIAVCAAAMVFIIRAISKARKEKAENIRKILDAPLETVTEDDDLLSKYKE